MRTDSLSYAENLIQMATLKPYIDMYKRIILSDVLLDLDGILMTRKSEPDAKLIYILDL